MKTGPRADGDEFPETHGSPTDSRESAHGEKHSASCLDNVGAEEQAKGSILSRAVHRESRGPARTMKPPLSLFDGDEQEFPTQSNDTLTLAYFYDCAWAPESTVDIPITGKRDADLM
ncbi:unnamed protein product, partial [Discosporangium mesarthrocarpum]